MAHVAPHDEEPRPGHSADAGHGSHGGHGDHAAQFRRLFWIMLVFAIPVIALVVALGTRRMRKHLAEAEGGH